MINDICTEIIKNKRIKSTVAIDCGHLVISSGTDGYIFGKNSTPSESEIFTFTVGVKVFNFLIKNGERAVLNLCLSDLSGLINGNAERRHLHSIKESERKKTLIPIEYMEILKNHNVSLDNIVIKLQSKGNEIFKKIIRKIRTNILSEKSKNINYNKIFLIKDMLA